MQGDRVRESHLLRADGSIHEGISSRANKRQARCRVAIDPLPIYAEVSQIEMILHKPFEFPRTWPASSLRPDAGSADTAHRVDSAAD